MLYELGIHDVHPKIVQALGHLRFRTSYGQNQLLHSKEVALLAGGMAAEMGLDVQMTKRAGVLHDVGKGMTHDQEGTHVELGYALCERYREPDQVLNAIRAHHDEETAPLCGDVPGDGGRRDFGIPSRGAPGDVRPAT